MSNYNSSSSSARVSLLPGCVGFIITMLVLWFLCFGATVNGTRYALGCDTDKGVVFTTVPQNK